MTKNKVQYAYSRLWRCTVCDKGAWKTDRLLAKHIAMKGNEYVIHDKYEIHKEWRRNNGLAKGYKHDKKEKINGQTDLDIIVEKVFELIKVGKVGAYMG